MRFRMHKAGAAVQMIQRRVSGWKRCMCFFLSNCHFGWEGRLYFRTDGAIAEVSYTVGVICLERNKNNVEAILSLHFSRFGLLLLLGAPNTFTCTHRWLTPTQGNRPAEHLHSLFSRREIPVRDLFFKVWVVVPPPLPPLLHPWRSLLRG